MCSSKKYPFSPPPTQGTFVLDPPPRHPPLPPPKKKNMPDRAEVQDHQGKPILDMFFFSLALQLTQPCIYQMESQATSKGAKTVVRITLDYYTLYLR